jgi:hypothetical protein
LPKDLIVLLWLTISEDTLPALNCERYLLSPDIDGHDGVHDHRSRIEDVKTLWSGLSTPSFSEFGRRLDWEQGLPFSHVKIFPVT